MRGGDQLAAKGVLVGEANVTVQPKKTRERKSLGVKLCHGGYSQKKKINKNPVPGPSSLRKNFKVPFFGQVLVVG